MLVVGNGGSSWWSPAAGELRTYAALSIFDANASPDGKRLALSLGDSRVVLASYDAIRAKATLSRATQIKVPAHCNGVIRLRSCIREETDEDPDDGGDIDVPCGGVDPCAP